jgi:outer membrane lipopolysaccharide assembly protein LptE/RlpB
VRPGPARGAQRIALQPFAEAGPVGIAGELDAALARALAADGLNVLADARRADAVLTGTLSQSTTPATTLRAVQAYALVLRVQAELRTATGVVWRDSIALQEDFLPPDPDGDAEPLVTERRRRVALLRLAEQAAQRLVDDLRLDGDPAQAEPGAADAPAVQP